MLYERVAWRPFATYRQEESGTRLHLAKVKAPRTLCGKSIPRDTGYSSPWSNSAAYSHRCKRCFQIAAKRGLATDRESIHSLPWANVQ